jgi:aromatic ring-cleaving dioxygenase
VTSARGTKMARLDGPIGGEPGLYQGTEMYLAKMQLLRECTPRPRHTPCLAVVVRKSVVQEVAMRRSLVLLFLVFLAHTAAAGERAGVSMPDAVTVDGKTLVLNGIGVRKATFLRIKGYVAGLYLEARSRNAPEIIRSEQVKRFDVVLLRDIDHDDAVDVWRKGLKRNGADMVKLKARFDRFASWIPDLKKHDTLSFLYVPERGVTVMMKGQVKGTIGGTDFATALFSIWLGANPADDDLKDQLLGK